MDKVLILADSRKYIRSNCFQLQLHESIKMHKKDFQIEYYYLNPRELQNFEMFKHKSKSFRWALSTLRQRVLFNNISLITKIVGDTPLKVYDQDPWQNYIDNSLTNGCYTLLQNNFQLSNIFVTSNYWANYISNVDKIPSIFVKMGMLPKLCQIGSTQVERGKSVEFKGSVHPHRQEAFSIMSNHGQVIKINLEILKYPRYLKYLQNLAIFVHDESGDWICRGEKIPMGTGMWVKDIEVASQGCFSIRNYNEESKTYSINNIPLIRFYNNPSEVKNIVDEIFSLSEKEFSEIQSSSVHYISANDNWAETTNKIFNL
jgi:hypothetical protein